MKRGQAYFLIIIVGVVALVSLLISFNPLAPKDQLGQVVGSKACNRGAACTISGLNTCTVWLGQFRWMPTSQLTTENGQCDDDSDNDCDGLTDEQDTLNCVQYDFTERTTGIVQGGKNIYYVSPSGNDHNRGSREQPLFNLNYVMNIAVPPARVIALPGKYLYMGATEDYFVSMKDNVDLFCETPKHCELAGAIYGASNVILDGFSAMPLAEEDEHPSTNEINFGMTRYGSPDSGNILWPGKFDVYHRSISNAIIRNNYIYNGVYRIFDSTNVDVLNNKNEIDRTDIQFYGIRLFYNNHDINIIGNDLESGRGLPPKLPWEPLRPSTVLIQNSENVYVADNQLHVNRGYHNDIVGYVKTIMDYEENTPLHSSVAFQNNQISGDYIQETRDYRIEYCGNNVCDHDEYTNLEFKFEYRCFEDCCGDSICDPAEEEGDFFCFADCVPVADEGETS